MTSDHQGRAAERATLLVRAVDEILGTHSEDRAECGREVRAAVADHELGPARLLAEVHDQVTGPLAVHSPVGCKVTPRNADAPGGVPVTKPSTTVSTWCTNGG